MLPGLHAITAAEYHADAGGPSLSASIAKLICQKSPLHAWHAHPRLNPAYRMVESEDMDRGTIAHRILLEGNEHGVAIVEADDWRTKAAKETRDAMRAVGRTPILAKKMSAVREMVAAARAYAASSELGGLMESGGGESELSMIWEEAGVLCRARPDRLASDRRRICDYKSTATSADPFAFARQIQVMGYDIQAAHYLAGLDALCKTMADFVFLVQENEPPYACSLVGVPPALVDLGRQKRDFALQVWKRCLATNEWNGYGPRINWAEPPEWAVAQWAERRSLDEMLELGSV